LTDRTFEIRSTSGHESLSFGATVAEHGIRLSGHYRWLEWPEGSLDPVSRSVATATVHMPLWHLTRVLAAGTQHFGAVGELRAERETVQTSLGQLSFRLSASHPTWRSTLTVQIREEGAGTQVYSFDIDASGWDVSVSELRDILLELLLDEQIWWRSCREPSLWVSLRNASDSDARMGFHWLMVGAESYDIWLPDLDAVLLELERSELAVPRAASKSV